MFMMCQSMGRPPISTMGLGLTAVSSARRVPMPPAKITVFMSAGPSRRLDASGSCFGHPPQDIEGAARTFFPTESLRALEGLDAQLLGPARITQHAPHRVAQQLDGGPLDQDRAAFCDLAQRRH